MKGHKEWFRLREGKSDVLAWYASEMIYHFNESFFIVPRINGPSRCVACHRIPWLPECDVIEWANESDWVS